MAFKFPTIKPGNKIPSFVSSTNIKIYSQTDITDIQRLGKGSFGTVILANIKGQSSHVVVKRICQEDDKNPHQRRLFFKEAMILHDLEHGNIVNFFGICGDPCSIILEYLGFDFKPFGGTCSVHSLEDFVDYVDDHDLLGDFPFQIRIGQDVANGLSYLHSKNIAHRDLKPANVLVDNSHYARLDVNQLQQVFATNPIVCKLTDFGESRGEAIQTSTVCHHGTVNIGRGTPVYMAPEIFAPKSGFIAEQNDLKSIDIWALGMVFFILLNPNLSYPFDLEIKDQRSKREWKEIIKSKMQKKEMPSHSAKYQIYQATEWYVLWDAFEKCLAYTPEDRPTAKEVCQLLSRKDCTMPCRNIPLSCSQSSTMERATGSIDNDGTNSCGLLAVILADMLINTADELPVSMDEWKEIATKVESVITNSPRTFNHLRDVNERYDAIESYTMLRKGGVIQSTYDFTEELLLAHKVYSPKGRNALEKSVRKIYTDSDAPRVAIFTCGLYTFLIGCKSGFFFIIDTHVISAVLGGNGNGILKLFPNHDDGAPKRLCLWVWTRLKESGVKQKELQSFAEVELISACDSIIPLSGGNKRPDSFSEASHSKRRKTSKKSEDAGGRKNGNDSTAGSGGDDYVGEGMKDGNEENTAVSLSSGDSNVSEETAVDLIDLTKDDRAVNAETSSSSNLSGSVNGLPVFKNASSGLTIKEILNICIGQKVPEEKICKKIPFMVDRSAVFVIDLNEVSPDDLTADDCGIYGGHSSPSVAVHVSLDDDKNIVSMETINKRDGNDVAMKDNLFIVRRQYSWHSLCKDYRRIITKVESNDRYLRYAIVQYIVKTNDCSKLFQKSNGNSKISKEPYFRTKPSVIARIREIGVKGSAKSIISQLEKEAGDVRTISSPSYLPRNREQVYNQLRKVKGRIKSRSTGPAKTPDITKLLSLQQSGTFLKDVSFGERIDKKGNMRIAPNTFAASDTCIGWVKRFCKGLKPAAVAGIDMTYKLGPFYLTTLTLPNPMFVYKSNENKHPTTLAAIMTSVTKEKRDYEYMARSLKAQGISTLTYGMDGECAMESGFEEVYPIMSGSSGTENIHLRCFDHVRDDISKKLLSIEIVGEEKNKIIDDILGKEYNGKRVNGLVDCITEAEFEEKYAMKEKEWHDDFKIWMTTKCGRIRSLKETIKQCMLKPVRVSAGLGNPPNKWSNQRTESMNNVIKEEAELQTSDQATIHEIIEERVIKQQQSEYIKAIYCTGEYRLSERYRKYSVGIYEWSQKSDEQKKGYIKHVLMANTLNHEEEQGLQVTKKLSISIAESGVTSVSPRLLSNIWHRAEIILSHHHVINVDNGVYCVTEFGNSTNVSVKAGRVICGCRQNNSTAGLCPHTLVVAEIMGTLQDYLGKFETKKGKTDKIVFANIPKRAGEKPKEKKKRKGKNNIESSPIVSEARKPDDEIDFAKPWIFTEIWHNKNAFQVVFTKDYKKVIKCESCKVEFPKGAVVCIPYDIAILHKERYFYPKNDEKGNVIKMEATWKKEAAKFYCMKKACILKRHPYFWKGLIKIDENVLAQLKESHRDLLRNMFNLSI